MGDNYPAVFVAMLPQLLIQVLVIAAGVWLGLTLYHRRK